MFKRRKRGNTFCNLRIQVSFEYHSHLKISIIAGFNSNLRYERRSIWSRGIYNGGGSGDHPEDREAAQEEVCCRVPGVRAYHHGRLR